MYRTVTVFALYFTRSIFARFFLHGIHLSKGRESQMYLFEFIILV